MGNVTYQNRDHSPNKYSSQHVILIGQVQGNLMFKCKVCEEKDKRISDLHKQIEFLKQLASPSSQIPLINYEANNVLNGAGNDEPELTAEEQVQLQKEKEERDALLSGNYN
jgi:hypothetical protein